MFRTKRRLIEFDTLSILEGEIKWLEYVEKTNSRLAYDILAGLSLGDLNFLNPELKISRELMVNYGIPSDWQARYFEAYHRAAQKNLNSDGSLIIEWLDKISTEFKSSPLSQKNGQKVNHTALITMPSEGYRSRNQGKTNKQNSGKIN